MAADITDWIQAASAVLTLATAITAVCIARGAPRLAAQYAEEYRRKNAAIDELDRAREAVFRTLMAHRGDILSFESRQAINLVDIVFAQVAEVRDARRLFMESANSRPFSAEQLTERYYQLLEAVARSSAISDFITGFDVRAGYLPIAVGKLNAAAIADAEERMARGAERQARAD